MEANESSSKSVQNVSSGHNTSPSEISLFDWSVMESMYHDISREYEKIREEQRRRNAECIIMEESLLEDEEPDTDKENKKPKPLSEHLVKDVFQCIAVNETEYLILNKLGKGGSSIVYHCYNPITKEEVAVKCVDLSQNKTEALGFINEVKALQRLQDCDRIIKLHQYEIIENTKLYVVLEKGGRDFSQILRGFSRNSTHQPAFMINFYWMQMLFAVQQMHSKGVIHSDLKPANFIEVRDCLKLIDFGISSCVQSADVTSIMKTVAHGTFGYISPEALCQDKSQIVNSPTGRPKYKIGFKSDVWSLGCILYELVYKRTPFAHIKHNYAKFATIMDPHHVIDYPPTKWVPSSVLKTIRMCLQYDARKRLTVEDLIRLNGQINV